MDSPIHVEKKFVWKEFSEKKDTLFVYVIESITEAGYNILQTDRQSGMISFETGMSFWTWGGQNMSVLFIDKGDITQVRVSGTMKQTGFFSQVYDWGESKKIGKKILESLTARARTSTSHLSNKKEKTTSWENSLKYNQGEENSQTKKDLSVLELKELITMIENSDPRILDVLSEEVNARIIDENYRRGFLFGLDRIIQDRNYENRKLPKRKRYSTI